MKILVFNCGSSTLKFQVIETGGELDSRKQERKLARGIVDRIGGKSAHRFEAARGEVDEKSAAVHDHEEAVIRVVRWLRSISESIQVDAVGHRLVHGGDCFAESARIDEDVVATLETLCEIAPLHNPPAVSGIRAAQKILGPVIPMVAVFDTSFHHTIPEGAATYAIPYELSQKHGIRRYGFHGLAHQYDVMRYGEITGTPNGEINVVTLHLGNGCSACAVRGGISVDTSMGFTPLEGLVMGTRSGDLDPALVSYLAHKEGVAADEVEEWLNKRSGLLGLSGLSNDMRELTAAYDENPRARLAVDVFCYRARKYLGAYLAVLGGAEAVIFSGGIGENSPLVREKICAGMEWCGLRLDAGANSTVIGRDGCISVAEAAMKAFVIHTDEEAIIAQETARLIQGC
ncbi:MAG TPA: acetate kinase [Candidatus Binatia bacterium]|nr:acetate kinase [Candidatus Binatia bacterium]